MVVGIAQKLPDIEEPYLSFGIVIWSWQMSSIQHWINFYRILTSEGRNSDFKTSLTLL